MAGWKSYSSILFLTVVITCSSVHATNSSSKEVYVMKDMCNQVIYMGATQGNWKRVLFPYNQPCTGHFDCTLTFRTRTRMKHNEMFMCVDFSRLRLYGANTSLEIIDKGQDYRSEKLSTSQYPQIQKGMTTVFCVYAHDDVELRFRAGCEKPLDGSFVSWMYVYIQGVQTGTIYYVDGFCSHMHSMGKRSYDSKVTLRSRLWPLRAGDLNHQCCHLRLLQSLFFQPAHVAVDWNRTKDNVIPTGVSVKIFKSTSGFEFEKYTVVKTYLTLKKGSAVRGDPKMTYPIDYSTEVMFKVCRSGPAQMGPRQSSLLFELVATRVPEPLKERKEDEEKSENQDSSSAGMYALKVGGACVAAVLVIAVVFFFWKRRSSHTGTLSAASASGHEGHTYVETESHSMLSTARQPASQGRQEQGGESAGDKTSASAPPYYTDLFPDYGDDVD